MSSPGLVVADDLTGATDTGHEFAVRGLRTLVLTPGARARDGRGRPDVRVVDTDSRYAESSAAAAAVTEAIRGARSGCGTDEAEAPPFVYKKVDSTLRGNLVAEIDAALDATGADIALVAVASPRNGRTTVEGYHLADGVPVAETEAGNDPDSPVETSHLPSRLSESSYPVVRLPIHRVAAGPDAVEADLSEASRAGQTVVVADASHERHLEALAEGAARSGRALIYVGSAGLARYVETPPPAADGPPSVPMRERRVLCVVGSTNSVTREQVHALPNESVVALDLETAVGDPATASEDAASACAHRLNAVGIAAVVSAPDPRAQSRAVEAGRRRDLDGQTVRRRVADALGGTVERLWSDGSNPPESLFVTGGAVAANALDVLAATGLSLTGEAVEEGIPLGRIVGGVADGTPVVTKAGAFGSAGAIRKCVARLGGRDVRE